MEEWRKVRILHDELGDPFKIMPMTSAAVSLRDGVNEAEEHFQSYMGEYGVSRKFWPVPCELTYEEMGIIIGNAFVLAQVPISQAVSLFSKIRESCNEKGRFPNRKSGILKYESMFLDSCTVSQIEAIDAVANYFKHYHEWPESWDENEARDVQKATLAVVKELGLVNQALTDNMMYSLQLLGIYDNDLPKLCHIVGEWRENLAKSFFLDPFIRDCLPPQIKPIDLLV
ncbi:hypothetical protein LCGC14_0194290 [marine sediment metagenome]|uniref:Uncharacterized protein n=1 Tax=marine sediment metagenome TaxID=412755 RepID=A0A0F9UL30_9ZZZZ|nr:hypothetical protein [Halomonas sp.]HDZ45499.1 hypothetical protein [Halomonas sp.]